MRALVRQHLLVQQYLVALSFVIMADLETSSLPCGQGTPPRVDGARDAPPPTLYPGSLP